MASASSSPIDDLAAPTGDAEHLIWPSPERLAQLVEENRSLLDGSSAKILNRTIGEWREPPGRGPVIFTGHQPAFYHPGVWAKNVVSTALARRLGGEAVFLAVDSDAPDRLELEWPVQDSGHYEIARAAVLPQLQGRSYEQLPPLSLGDCAAFATQVFNGVDHDGTTPLRAFLKSFGESQTADYVSRWAAGMQAIDQTVGAATPTIERVSDRFDTSRSTEAAAFVGHLLIHADSFSSAYNGALQAYRAARGIRGDRHPIPDLLVTDERFELPFWVLGRTESRRRFFVSRSRTASDAVVLWAGQERIGDVDRAKVMNDPQNALGVDLGSPQIRPRALALTIYARILACDLFIHGIGGAKYDQIADEIIHRFFGIEPPAYACVSATMRLPLRRHAVTRDDERACRRRLRDLRYNPQRYLDGGPYAPMLDTLTREREQAIALQDRLRAESPTDHAARRAAFLAIRRANKTLSSAVGDLPHEFQKEAASVSAALSENRIAEHREWFMGLFPTARLVELQDSIVGSLS
ncbi:MAG TPA: hypothetical protein VJZ71_05495 [Phycisphaerae bacterium]|nr:hypothetical protein [Phycisphaerae bacterium]